MGEVGEVGEVEEVGKVFIYPTSASALMNHSCSESSLVANIVNDCCVNVGLRKSPSVMR